MVVAGMVLAEGVVRGGWILNLFERQNHQDLQVVWTWVGEKYLDQSNWKGDLPFPKMRRSKLGVGRWEAGAWRTSQWRWQVGRWESESAVPRRGLGTAGQSHGLRVVTWRAGAARGKVHPQL